jgi:hypothetical protein
MKQPTDLLQTLLEAESAETAVAIYKEAASYAQQFKDVQTAALACAQADLQTSGETKRKTIFGSCGWTNPQSDELDKAAWQTAVAANPDLLSLETAVANAQNALRQAQQPYSRRREPAFYIR